MKKSIHSKRQAALIECLVKARNKAGLTQQQLADRLGKHQSFIAKYENDERRLDVIELIEILEQLGCDPLAIVAQIRDLEA